MSIQSSCCTALWRNVKAIRKKVQESNVCGIKEPFNKGSSINHRHQLYPNWLLLTQSPFDLQYKAGFVIESSPHKLKVTPISADIQNSIWWIRQKRKFKANRILNECGFDLLVRDSNRRRYYKIVVTATVEVSDATYPSAKNLLKRGVFMKPFLKLAPVMIIYQDALTKENRSAMLEMSWCRRKYINIHNKFWRCLSILFTFSFQWIYVRYCFIYTYSPIYSHMIGRKGWHKIARQKLPKTTT